MYLINYLCIELYSGFSRILIACYTHFSAACCWLRSSSKRESLAGNTEGAREARIDTRHPLHFVESCCFLRQYNVQCICTMPCIVGINIKNIVCNIYFAILSQPLGSIISSRQSPLSSDRRSEPCTSHVSIVVRENTRSRDVDPHFFFLFSSPSFFFFLFSFFFSFFLFPLPLPFLR